MQRAGAKRPLCLALAALFLAGLLAGCTSDPDGSSHEADDAVTAPQAAPWAVVALVDSGINPYHADFRLEGPLAGLHPSAYIPGYPADIPAVDLSLDAADLESALEADKEVWSGLDPETPYWFRGTRVTGISFGSAGEGGPVFSTGHGHMVASKAAGAAHSLCPTCHVVAAQGTSGAAVDWSSQQAWIDVQSNSWGPPPAFAWADRTGVLSDPDLAMTFADAAARQAVFVAAGNGLGGAFGVVGNPSPFDSTSGPPGVISVGGNDNGKTTFWSGWMPHVVADACDNWASVGNSMNDYSERAGGGTSAASPYTAGGAARLILEARTILRSDAVRDPGSGVYAVAAPDAVLPSAGPLADGDLTLDELKGLLFHTANPVPRGDAASGAECQIDPEPTDPFWVFDALYPTGIDWSTFPDGTPTYPWIGYGAVENDSIALAIGVLRGDAEPLERPQADQSYALDQELRRTYHGIP